MNGLGSLVGNIGIVVEVVEAVESESSCISAQKQRAPAAGGRECRMAAMEPVTSWIRGSLIGAGAYGMVNLALNKSNGQLFAVKSIECNERSGGEMQAMENELQMLQSLNSPWVVKCFGSDVTSEEGKVMKNMFMEHMAGGSLADLMKLFGGQFDEALIRNYTRGILEGIHYLHSQGIVHCDIKGKNVLAGSSGVKLADFGGARRLSGDNSTNVLRIKGTPLWMAPEVVNQKEQGTPSDIWSLGCTVIEMATGKAPWSEQIIADPMASLLYIGRMDEVPGLPSCLSKQGQDFLGKCLQRDPRVRWTAAQLLQHPFITEKFCSSAQSNKVSAASFCKAAAALSRQNSPVSVLQSPRSSTATTNTSSSMGNSVPILQCPAFFNRFPAGLNFSSKFPDASPINRQEPATSSTSVSDFWADSPVTPQPNEWIVVRSPKTPSSVPSLSSSPSSCPTRKMLAPILSSPASVWGGGATVVPKEKSTMVVQTRENHRLPATDALRRIFSPSDAVLQTDLRMAEAHDNQGLNVLPALLEIPMERTEDGDKRPSCSSSSTSSSGRCEGGEESSKKRLLSSLSSIVGAPEDINDTVTRRRRRPEENVGRFSEQAAGIDTSSPFRGPGNSDSDPSLSSSLRFFGDSRKRAKKKLKCSSPSFVLDEDSGMSLESMTLAWGIIPPLRAQTGRSDDRVPNSPLQCSRARSLTWQLQRPREELTANNSICSYSFNSVKSSVPSADSKESTKHHSSKTDSFLIKRAPAPCGSCIPYMKLSLVAVWVICFHSVFWSRFFALLLMRWGIIIAVSISAFASGHCISQLSLLQFLSVGDFFALDILMGARVKASQSKSTLDSHGDRRFWLRFSFPV